MVLASLIIEWVLPFLKPWVEATSYLSRLGLRLMFALSPLYSVSSHRKGEGKRERKQTAHRSDRKSQDCKLPCGTGHGLETWCPDRMKRTPDMQSSYSPDRVHVKEIAQAISDELCITSSCLIGYRAVGRSKIIIIRM